MKRIISLIMSVLMIATMFCGFAVTGNAADGENYTTTTLDVVDNGDGTYNVKLWATDETPYGFVVLGIKLNIDETKLEYVPYHTASWTNPSNPEETKMQDYIFNITPAYNFADDTVQTRNETDVMITLGGDSNNKLERKKVFMYEPAVIMKSSAAPTNAAFQFTQEYFDYCYNELWIDEPIKKATFDQDKGMLLAEAVIKVKPGASGDAVISTETFQLSIAEGNNKGRTVEKVGCSTEDSYTIPLGSAEPAYELNVEDGASIRKEYPEGMRFTASVTAADFSAIDEMGVAIVKAGTEPDATDTPTLKIPARVDTAGNYLHNYELNENGTKVFTDGVIAEAGTVKFTGVLSNIKEANLSVEFTAYAYIKIDGEYTYSTTVCTRSYDAVLAKVVDDVFAE